MRFNELTSDILKNLIQQNNEHQKYIPYGTVFAMPSHVYAYHDNLKDFIEKNEKNTQLCIGFSSGGAT